MIGWIFHGRQQFTTEILEGVAGSAPPDDGTVQQEPEKVK